MNKFVALAILVLVTCTASMAATVTAVPEIDPGSGTAALALLAGAALVLRGRRIKK